MLKPTRILLVDDHRLLRAGLCSLLNSLSGIEVIAQADNGREAIRLANTHHPDLVIMDIAMAELNGLDATIQLKKDYPHPK